MYKNQLQELAQRSCFNLPSYTCIREGPDHAPRFKASVNFNGEIFEGPTYATTLRQAEHAAAEAALSSLSSRSGPSRSLTARLLDESGVYKNLLQETAHRAGLKLPSYTTVRSGPGHVPVFTSTVELAGMNFTGESAKTKKQAEKNAAIVAWSSLKTIVPNWGHLWEFKQHEDHHGIGVVRSGVGGRDGSSRVIRRRYQYQRGGGRRRETSNSSQRQWQGLMDPLILAPNPAGLDTNCRQRQKQSILLSLPTILPPKDSPPPPPVPVQRDDHDWINRISPAINNKPLPTPQLVVNGSVSNSSSHFYRGNAVSHIPATIPLPENAITQKSSTILYPNSQIGKSTVSGVYHHHPQRIAPAVQIRSVIPVCAAPPVRLRPSGTPLIMKEASSSSSSSAQSELLASTLSKLKL